MEPEEITAQLLSDNIHLKKILNEFFSPQITEQLNYSVKNIIKPQRYTGLWMKNRRSYTQLEKLGSLGNVVSISIDAGGNPIMENSRSRLKLHEIKPDVLRSLAKKISVFYFYEDEQGNSKHFSATMWGG